METTGSRVLTQAEVLLAKEEAYAKLRADNKALLDALRAVLDCCDPELCGTCSGKVLTALAEHSEPQ